MDTTVQALQALYVKKGGSLDDVSDVTTIPDMINAISALTGTAGSIKAIDDGDGTVTLSTE